MRRCLKAGNKDSGNRTHRIVPGRCFRQSNPHDISKPALPIPGRLRYLFTTNRAAPAFRFCLDNSALSCRPLLFVLFVLFDSIHCFRPLFFPLSHIIAIHASPPGDFFKKTVDFAGGILYNDKAFEQCVEKSRSLVERARLEIVYTP